MAAEVESDWTQYAACQVELPNPDLFDDVEDYERAYNTALGDTSFIREPDDVTAKRWARVCSRCPVIQECWGWAERTKAAGVFAAGEWRE